MKERALCFASDKFSVDNVYRDEISLITSLLELMTLENFWLLGLLVYVPNFYGD